MGASGLVALAVMALLALALLRGGADERFGTGVRVGDRGQTSFGGDDYGDNPVLDDLWDRCGAGDGDACDDLYWTSAVGSEYERFGNTCGDRYGEHEVPFSCADVLDARPR